MRWLSDLAADENDTTRTPSFTYWLFNEMLLFTQYSTKKHNILSSFKRNLESRGLEEIHTNQKLNKLKCMEQEAFRVSNLTKWQMSDADSNHFETWERKDAPGHGVSQQSMERRTHTIFSWDVDWNGLANWEGFGLRKRDWKSLWRLWIED